MLKVFDHPVRARCQLHRLRNVRDRLPERLRSTIQKRMRAAATPAQAALDAEAQLTTLARELDRAQAGAAASPREGMAETLTVLRLGVSPPSRTPDARRIRSSR